MSIENEDLLAWEILSGAEVPAIKAFDLRPAISSRFG
jgi:hypothetical protein